MSDASFQLSRAFRITRVRRAVRPLPTGFGLLVGATSSLGLWAILIWLGSRLIG